MFFGPETGPRCERQLAAAQLYQVENFEREKKQ